jgi:hypothetical protein
MKHTDVDFYSYKRVPGKKKWIGTGKVTVIEGSYNSCVASAKKVFTAKGIDFEYIDFGASRNQKNFVGDSENFVTVTVTVEEMNHFGTLSRVAFYKRLHETLGEALKQTEYDDNLNQAVKLYWGEV